ncbi:hypothetical protein IQ276_037210 [Desmonostoc muscorum LEGE 12446]|uniref:TrbG/VirB9 family P-type conjugative transfer protein n=1 Tax=Desmonostoc muscorum LEGE 12446 TaxID=1828758 RepID=A0A8J7DC08_DESMC|nr:hypothetical protein [Desmonostoc muscorum]MCF2151951.1 hypothetical protein [Desmonostoc muscorum LEGE 12446]
MKRVLALAATLLLINSSQVLAGSVRSVYSQDVDSNSLELKVWKGYGLTINFMSTGEIIKQVWIGDPTRFAFTSNGNLCPKGSDEPDCAVGQATVLFLRQIKPINFPALTSSKDGSTQIIVLTNQKQYQFKLIPATGEPSYTSLMIKPDEKKPKPLLVSREPTQSTGIKKTAPSEEVIVPEPQNVVIVRSTSRSVPSGSIQRNDANAVVAGLAVANRNGQIKSGSTAWKKAQDAIRLLRQGKSREEAISRSGISKAVFNQLIEWGKTP